MRKWNIEMCYTTKIAIGLEAETQDEAIEKAKNCIEENVGIEYGQPVDEVGALEYDHVTYIEEVKEDECTTQEEVQNVIDTMQNLMSRIAELLEEDAHGIYESEDEILNDDAKHCIEYLKGLKNKL